MQKGITIRDIARLANVDPSTVSRSLNDSPLVAPETKERIRRLAQEGNFAFNAGARGLVTRRTRVIGLIYPDHFNEYQYSYFLTLLMNKIRDSLEEDRYDLIVKFRKNHTNGENNIRYLVSSNKVDGLLIVHSMAEQSDFDFLHKKDVPFVLIQAKPIHARYEHENWVFADHQKGGYIATSHLISLGHRDILCLMLDSPQQQFAERAEGYRKALLDNSLPVREERIVSLNGTFESSYEFMLEHRSLLREFTAIFAQTDIIALGAIKAIEEMGLSVPDDKAVVAYDDIEFGKHFRPRLTTVHQPRDQLAMIGCERIRQMLVEEEPSEPMHRLIEPYLIVRESCGAERYPHRVYKAEGGNE